MNETLTAQLDGRGLPWVQAGDCLLVNADARMVLPLIPAASIDCVLTDPPYGIEHETNHGASWEGKQIAGDSDTAIRDFIIEWCGQRPWACFGTWKVPTPASARGVLVWDKGPAFGMGDLSFPWKASWEEIAVGGVGWAGYRDEGVIRGHLIVSWESKGRVHPHQKPVSLIEYLLSKLADEMGVCDPTAGSFTTAVACVRSGRRCIAIEIDSDHFAKGVARVRDELARTRLIEPPAKITQSSLFEARS